MEKIWKSAILIIGLALIFSACGSDTSETSSGEQAPLDIAPLPPTEETVPQQQPTQQQPPGEVNIPAGADGIVHHYICNDRCEGGHSESPGFCPVCNQQLAHNRAWHEQPQQQQQQQQQSTGQADPRTQFDPMRGGGTTPPQQQQQQPQGQMEQVNIPAGPDGIVHHYICIDRCNGGHSEGAGFCPVCNKQLAHNQAWHNQ